MTGSSPRRLEEEPAEITAAGVRACLHGYLRQPLSAVREELAR